MDLIIKSGMSKRKVIALRSDELQIHLDLSWWQGGKLGWLHLNR
jgi:hypothetical protein